MSPEEKVKCAICGEEFVCITIKHLRRHGTDMVHYRMMFPNNKTESEDFCHKMSNIMAKLPSNRRKGILAKKSTMARRNVDDNL